MIITCPRCSTRYVIDPTVLPPGGRVVGCSSCGHHWTQPPLPLEEPPAAAGTANETETEPDSAHAAQAPSEPPEGTGRPASSLDQPLDPPRVGGSEPEIQPEDEPAGDADSRVSETEGRPPETTEPIPPAPAGAPADVAGEKEQPSILEPPVLSGAEEQTPDSTEPEPIPAALRKRKPTVNSGKPKQKIKVNVTMLAGLGALAAFIVMVSVLMLARGPIVSAVPGAAGVYRAVGLLGDEPGAGLEIRDVRSARQRSGADEVLTIEGTVANVTDEDVNVPLISVSLSDGEGEELQSVTVPADRSTLPPGETGAFEARIVNPSAIVRRVKVKFEAPSEPPGH